MRGECTHFVWLNRGKESVVVDLRKASDRRLFEALLARADVFLQNLKPGALAKLGYGIETLRQRYPASDLLLHHRLWRCRAVSRAQGL